ncbi:hypothetical protein HanIR_Chr04g0179401 [Helianthus annuus]|nr:hypothetical protein HanIR_Chr04g0179401 [Helianthus annuus]
MFLSCKETNMTHYPVRFARTMVCGVPMELLESLKAATHKYFSQTGEKRLCISKGQLKLVDIIESHMYVLLNLLAISEEKLSHTWPDPSYVWYF